MARVLIVEDEKPVREMLDDFLTGEGFDTLQAENGLRAVELARAERPDLILMDLMLPVMDGLRAIQVLKGSPDTWSIPIVAMSENHHLLRAGAGVPCAAAMRKPFDLDLLLDLVLIETNTVMVEHVS
jgi:CheY-like chemotaxis protein